jgi:hypothetical protein
LPLRSLLQASRARERRGLLVVLAVFVASRVAIALLGFHFDTRQLPHAVQNVDPELLRRHLAQSIWYLHGQPPLWNLLEGVVLKLAPTHWGAVFHALFVVLGVVETFALYLLLRGFGLRDAVAVVLTALLVVAPATLVYENLLFYDYPTLVLLTCAALAVQRFVTRPTAWRAACFAAIAGAVILTRTLFQIGWLVVALAAMLALLPRARRAILVGAALPLLVVAAVYVKNWIVFGSPTTSSWTGMGLARSVQANVPIAARERLVREDVLHRVSLLPPLSSLAEYRAAGAAPRTKRRGIPILDRPRKTTDARNLHNLAYVRISSEYLHDDLWLIRHRTGDYLRSIKLGLSRFLWPPTHAYGLRRNTNRIHAWNSVYSLVVYGSTHYANRAGFVLLLAYALVVVLGLVAVLRTRRTDPRAVTLLFIWWTVVYVGVVGNLSEYGENYRFRFVLDPLVVAALAALPLLRTSWALSARLRRHQAQAGVAERGHHDEVPER